ncbi:ATP-binding protein [Patescibacteria group bacterium]|nr:ATP-binding protein [Patescibacteria group bacterium]MBU4141962.1 ATP-binding protein [Patescibacteria group bacterium]
MINETVLKEVLVSQKKVFLNKKDLFQREILENFYEKYNKQKEILIITGIRRAGKSSLMKLIWDDFKSKQLLNDDQLLYFNFEDERLVGFDRKDFDKLLEAYYQLNSPADGKKIFLFLDEVQNIKYWEKWLNRLYEEGKYKIFATGSNATLLSSEMSSALTGRNIPVSLFPLSFYEYYAYFKNKPLDAKSIYDLDQKADIKKALAEYVKLGGMPEYLKTESAELIQEYFRDILSRDIVNRYNIKYKQGLKELAHLLLSNIGQIYSLKNLSKTIEIKNIGTIKNYLQYLENSFLFFKAPLFSYSYKKQIYNPDKIYAIDVAFFHNIAFKISDNAGPVYENIVFLRLIRNMDNEVFYYKTKENFEIDFAVKRKNKVLSLIQVCYQLNNAKIIEREERALAAGMEDLGLKEGFIINEDIEKAEKIGDKKINYIPLWKWLLMKE